jgi:hypothetical protein
LYTSRFTRPDTRFTEKLRGVKFSKVYMDVYMEIYTSKFTRPTRDAITSLMDNSDIAYLYKRH